MKFKSNPHNKTILVANGRTVKHEGQLYFIRATTLGSTILAAAEPIPQGGALIDIFDKTPTARAIRKLIESRLVS